MTDQPSYELLEDVPAHVTQVRAGRTTATRTNGQWINQNGQIVPLDASGPWTPIVRVDGHRTVVYEDTFWLTPEQARADAAALLAAAQKAEKNA